MRDPSATDENSPAGAPINPLSLLPLIALAMSAFAANSILNRLAIASFHMHPIDFATIRITSGALMLMALVLLRQNRQRSSQSDALVSWTLEPPGRARLAGAAMLAVYMLGFSWAYTALDAGLGALILFGVLQIVVFAWSVREGQNIPLVRWLGAAVAIAGLFVLLWPSGTASVPLLPALAMAGAGVGWGVYTLLGRGQSDALGATAGNFGYCIPVAAVAMWAAGGGPLSVWGVTTAIIAGSLTSGLGYALWYRILPAIPSTIAGIAQLSVPVIALLAGVLLLDEPLTGRLVVASALVLGGVAISLIPDRVGKKSP